MSRCKTLTLVLACLLISCGGRGSPCPRAPGQGAVDGGKSDSQRGCLPKP